MRNRTIPFLYTCGLVSKEDYLKWLRNNEYKPKIKDEENIDGTR